MREIRLFCYKLLFMFFLTTGVYATQQAEVALLAKDSVFAKSSVYLATFIGDMAEVKKVVEQEGKVNAQNEDGNTLCHIACKWYKREVIDYLLSKGARLDIRNRWGKTPLHNLIDVYFIHGNIELIKKLAKKEAASCQGVWKTGALHDAVDGGIIEVVKVLIENGAHTEVEDEHGHTPLYYAWLRDNKEMVNYLVSHGATFYMTSAAISEMVISSIIKKGWIDTIKIAIARGMDLNYKYEGGQVFFHYACEHGNAELADLLFQAGANPHIKDNTNVTPLHAACFFKNTEMVRWLLKKGSDPNCQETENLWTPLHLAVYVEWLEGVKLLIRHKAASLKDAQGCTPFYLACKMGDNDLIRYFLGKRKISLSSSLSTSPTSCSISFDALKAKFLER